MTYEDFIQSKLAQPVSDGFDCEPTNKYLRDYQRHIVKRALKQARFAILGDCGTGKSIMQLSWADEVQRYTAGPVLILCPLAVAAQTIREGEKFGVTVKRFSGTVEPGIFITNYEQLKNLPEGWAGVVADESSILKNYSGAIRNLMIARFMGVRFKLACTATPSPNDELEIGNHSEWLDYKTSMDMRAEFFTTDKNINNGEKYRLKRHSIRAFYAWISTWAVMFSKPSDIGFQADGFDLPELVIHQHLVDNNKQREGYLIIPEAVSATEYHAELRDTEAERIAKVCEVIAKEPKKQWIIWINQNGEGVALKKLIPDAVEVKGSDTDAHKENTFADFADGKLRVLITKAKIAQFGLNFQSCSRQIFAGMDFSFEAMHQRVRRSWRFGQKSDVHIHLVTVSSMRNVIDSIKAKQEKFIQMQKYMIENINAETPKGYSSDGETYQTDNALMMNGDCVEKVKTVANESIDYTFFSPPFGALYVFSDNPHDMSNVKNNDEFFNHFRFLIPELLRVTKPGRLCSLHIMQSTTLLGRDGFYSIVDFRGEIIREFQKAGWYFHGEHMIRKDPKTAAIRTKNRQLMHGTTKSDSSVVRPGLADYILTFRKPGENQVPIRNEIPFDLWCEMAEPIWWNVDEGDVMKDSRKGRDERDERHITATQLKPIEWLYLMYSNKGDTVLSPFAGIGSESFQAIKMGRKALGIELKPSYFSLLVENCKRAEVANSQLELGL